MVIKLCLPWMIMRLDDADGYGMVSNNKDMIQLLILIQGICCRFDNHCQGVFSLMQTKKRIYLFIQDYSIPTNEYLL